MVAHTSRSIPIADAMAEAQRRIDREAGIPPPARRVARLPFAHHTGREKTIRSGKSSKTRPVPGRVEPMNPEIIGHPILEQVQDPIDHPVHDQPHHRPMGEKEMRAKRMAEALDMRIAGFNYREIAERQETSVRSAYYDVQTALSYLARYQIVRAEELRALESQRLDFIQSALWPDVEKGDVFAAQTVLKVMDMRAKLYGLYVTDEGMPGTAGAIGSNRPFVTMTPEQVQERRAKLLARAAQTSSDSKVEGEGKVDPVDP